MKTAKCIGKIIISGIIAVAILSVVVLCFNYAGIHITNKTRSTDYVWRPNELKTTVSEGYAWLKMDSNGYNNDSVCEKPDILIIGSSHMEALMLKRSDNVASLLSEYTGLSEYNIGISGHTFYRCVDNYENALNRFSPNKYAVIETDSVELSISAMQDVIDCEATPIPSYDTGIIFYLQQIPAFRPIYNKLERWVELSNNKSVDVPNEENTEITDDYEHVLREFLSVVSEQSKEKGIIPIIFYHPSETLNSDGNVSYNTNTYYCDIFASTCKDLGIVFVDMTESFAKMYSEDHVLAHGFTNTSVGTGHLNKYAHKAIAERISAIINDMEVE